jgi:hypothetical protein
MAKLGISTGRAAGDLRARFSPRRLLDATLAAAACLALTAASLPASAGERAQRLAPFSALQIEVPAHYVVRAASASNVRLHGPAEVLERIVVDQHDDTVRIYSTGNLTIKEPLEIEVAALGLKKLEISGAGTVEGRGFSGEEFSLVLSGAVSLKLTGLDVESFKAELNGSGDVMVSGRANSEKLTMSGASRYRAANLAADKVDLKVEGAGDAEVFAREKLHVKISGAGNVRYRGEPKVSQSIDGAGTVAQM